MTSRNLFDSASNIKRGADFSRQRQERARQERSSRQKRRDEQEREARWARQKERDELLALLYPGINTRPKFSRFTLAHNTATRGTRAPALKGKAVLLDIDGAPIEFELAAWGPHKARTGGPGYYNVTVKPKDPALTPSRPIAEAAGARNPPAHFALKKIGTGRLFEHRAAQLTGTKRPTLSGYGLVQLPSGPAYIDLAAWLRDDGTYSGRAPLHDPAAVTARAAKRRPEPKPSPRPRSTNRKPLPRTAEARLSPEPPALIRRRDPSQSELKR